MTQKTEETEKTARRVRAVLPRSIYRMLAVKAAEEEASVNEVFVRAVTEYAAKSFKDA